MIGRGARAVAPGFATLVALACGGGAAPVSLAPPTGQTRHQDYDEIRERWTRGARIIKQLDTTLRVHATFLAPEFNAAYYARSVHMFRLSYEKRSGLKRELDERWDKTYPFVVASATRDDKWNDFDDKKSIWNIALVNDRGEQVDATEIRRLPKNATFKELFPYIGHFHHAYRITFPKMLPNGRPLVDRTTKNLALRFAGPLGQANLTWRLR